MSRAFVVVVLLFGSGVCGFTMERTNTGFEKPVPRAPPSSPTEHQASNNTPDIDKRILGVPEMQIPPGRLNELIYESLGPPQIAPLWQFRPTNTETSTTGVPYTINEEDLDAIFDEDPDEEPVDTPLETDQENVDKRPGETIVSSVDINALKTLWPNESSLQPTAFIRRNETDGSDAEGTVKTEVEKYEQEIKKIYGTPTETDTTENDADLQPNLEFDESTFNFTGSYNDTEEPKIIVLENGTIIYDFADRLWSHDGILKIYQRDKYTRLRNKQQGHPPNRRNLLSTEELPSPPEQYSKKEQHNYLKQHSEKEQHEHNASSKIVLPSFIVLIVAVLWV